MQLCYYPIFPCYLNVNWVITAISCFYSSFLSVSEILFHSLEFTSTSPCEIRLPIGTFFIQILMDNLHILLLIVCIYIIVEFFFYSKKPPTFNNWTFIFRFFPPSGMPFTEWNIFSGQISLQGLTWRSWSTIIKIILKNSYCL